MIVEDSPALLDAMSEIVEALGYQPIGVNNGAEALAVLAQRAETIALVLSDLVMPVMDGSALFRAVRGRGLATPFVLLSGHPLHNEFAGLKAEGLNGWLLKPPKIDDLSNLVAEILRKAPRTTVRGRGTA